MTLLFMKARGTLHCVMNPFGLVGWVPPPSMYVIKTRIMLKFPLPHGCFCFFQLPNLGCLEKVMLVPGFSPRLDRGGH